MKKTLLVIDRDETLRRLYSKIFDTGHMQVIEALELSEGINLIREEGEIDAVVVDYYYLESNGLDTLSEIKAIRPSIGLLVTGQVATPKVIECIQNGADNFVEKPFTDLEVLKTSIESLFQRFPNDTSSDVEKNFPHLSHEANRLVGQSKSIMELKRLAYKVAPLDSTVLILGETGTGKEVLSRMIHSMSPQKDQNFVAVHCGGIPDTLLESALFGHEKGSFTGAYRTQKGYFEIADGGTILLDEIGDTTSSMQVKMLRILQNKQYRRVGGTATLNSRARIIAATNRDLHKMVDEETFRRDLFYRLNVVTLKIPSLRERPEDIPLLIRYFMSIYTKKHNKVGVYLKNETIEILQHQPWYGNVRELENEIERLVALTDSDWIGPDELPQEYLDANESDYFKQLPFLPYSDAKSLFEKEYISRLLSKTDGNISQAARLAGMPRQNLHQKIKKHNLKPKKSYQAAPVSEN